MASQPRNLPLHATCRVRQAGAAAGPSLPRPVAPRGSRRHISTLICGARAHALQRAHRGPAVCHTRGEYLKISRQRKHREISYSL